MSMQNMAACSRSIQNVLAESASRQALQQGDGVGSRCSGGLLSASLVQQQATASRGSIGREGLELQSILQNTGGGASFFGVSPPVRSGWQGGAANPISHDNTWARAAYSASHTNLQALREIESNGISFLRGDLLKLGSTPPDARMSWNPEALQSHLSSHPPRPPPCPPPCQHPSAVSSSSSFVMMAPSSPMMMAVDGPGGGRYMGGGGGGGGGFPSVSHRHYDYPSSGAGFSNDNYNGGGGSNGGGGVGANAAAPAATGVLPFSCRTEYFFK